MVLPNIKYEKLVYLIWYTYYTSCGKIRVYYGIFIFIIPQCTGLETYISRLPRHMASSPDTWTKGEEKADRRDGETLTMFLPSFLSCPHLWESLNKLPFPQCLSLLHGDLGKNMIFWPSAVATKFFRSAAVNTCWDVSRTVKGNPSSVLYETISKHRRKYTSSIWG